MSPTTVSMGTQGAKGSFREDKVDQSRHARIRSQGKKKTNRTKQNKQSRFLGVEEGSPACSLWPCLALTDVFDVPREAPEALRDFKLSKKSPFLSPRSCDISLSVSSRASLSGGRRPRVLVADLTRAG